MIKVNKIFSEELFFDPLQRDIARLIKHATEFIEPSNKVECPLPKELWVDILSIVGNYDVLDERTITNGNVTMQLPLMVCGIDDYESILTNQISEINKNHSDKEIAFVLYTGYYHRLLQTSPPKLFTLIGGFLLY